MGTKKRTFSAFFGRTAALEWTGLLENPLYTEGTLDYLNANNTSLLSQEHLLKAAQQHLVLIFQKTFV